jgi:signal transduction histidine kinase
MSTAVALRGRTPGASSSPGSLLLYAVIFPPGAALTTAAFWPMWENRPVLALGNEILSLALLAVGILLLDEPSEKKPAFMLIGSSALLTAGWLDSWHAGPLPLISVPASPLGIVLASWAMFCYPGSAPQTAAGRRFFPMVLGWLVIAEFASILVARPASFNFPPQTWWPTLWPSQTIFTAMSVLIDLAGIVFAIAYMLLWIRRWKRSRGIARRLALPVATAASVVGAATVGELAARAASVSPAMLEDYLVIESYLQIGVPAAFLVAVMYRRFTRARIADLVLHLRGPSHAESVTEALRAIFEDPGLEVVSGPSATRILPRSDIPEPLPHSDADGRRRVPVPSSSGEQLAVILLNPAMPPEDSLVRAAVAATSFALENAHLEAALRAQLQEVRASRRRIIEAGTTERRRLERDLHDGIQQRLLAIKILLAAAGDGTTDSAAQTLISRARNELGQVLGELRELAHGIHPAALSQFGLDQAIKDIAERHSVPIDVDLPPGRFTDAAEITAYYVIAEAITNAIKHARAKRITVTGRDASGALEIIVTDDGRGGASIAAGTGIRGILDRVRAVGGDVDLHSPAGHGTQIRAQIPCA